MYYLLTQFWVISIALFSYGSCDDDHQFVKEGHHGQNYCGIGSTFDVELNVQSYVLPVKKEGDTKKIRIAFLGDSITEGYYGKVFADLKELGTHGYLTNGAKNGFKGYVYKIWEKLNKQSKGGKYEILNFGFHSRFLKNKEKQQAIKSMESNSYYQTCDYIKALESQSDIYVIMLGTCDVLTDGSVESKAEHLKEGFRVMAKQLLAQPQKPELYLMIPPPIIKERLHNYFPEAGTKSIINWLPGVIRETAKELGLKESHVINLQEVISVAESPKLLQDHVHPTDLGHQKIADKVFQVLFPAIKQQIAQKSAPISNKQLKLSVK